MEATLHYVDTGDVYDTRLITCTLVSKPTPPSPPFSRLLSPPSVACAGSAALCRRQQRAEQLADRSHASLETDTTVWRQRCSVSTAAKYTTDGRSLVRQSRHHHRRHRVSAVCLHLCEGPVEAVLHYVDGGDERSSWPIARTPVLTLTPPSPPLGRLRSPL